MFFFTSLLLIVMRALVFKAVLKIIRNALSLDSEYLVVVPAKIIKALITHASFHFSSRDEIMVAQRTTVDSHVGVLRFFIVCRTFLS
jgi:hypothetical protein